MNQICLSMKRRAKLLLLAFSVFSIICSGLFALKVFAAGADLAVQGTVYHQHAENCYSLEKCGGTGRLDEYMVDGCSCNMEHPCISHGCWWEDPNSMYPTGCWHCYCPKDVHWVCTRCYRLIPGSVCDHEERKMTCGKEGSVTARIFVEKAGTDWCTQLDLKANVELSGAVLSDTPYIWDGTASDQNVYTVTENGIHTFQLQADGNSNTVGAVISVLVNNIDTTGSQIISYEQDPSEGWTKEPAKLIITDIQDLQPDGSTGCGLAELPISFNGGEWTAERVFICEDSGAYTVCLKDALGNVSEAQVTVSRVDVTGPTVDFVWDQTPNLTEVTVTVQAADNQKDGSAGCGLAALPYSYDNGETWTDRNSFDVSENGTYTVLVKDKMGNITEASVEISNLDTAGPEVAVTMTPEEWYGEGNVTITVEAVDEGSGLGEAPYSWDGGETWTDEAVKEVEEAGDYKVLVRDEGGNITEREVKVIKKDRPRQEPDNNGNSENSDSDGSDGADGNSGADENSGTGESAGMNGIDDIHSGDSDIGSDDKDASVSGNGDGLDGETDSQKDSTGDRDSEKNQSDNEGDDESGKRQLTSKTQWKPTESDSENDDRADEQETDALDKNSTEESTEADSELEMEETTVKEEEALAQSDQKENVRRSILKTETAKVVTIAASTALLISVVGLLCFLLLMGVLVYDDNGNGHYRLLGMRICRRQEDCFMLMLPRSMTEKSETGRYRLCPGMLFAILNQDEEMLVESEEEQRKVSVKIAKKMEIRL